MVQMSSCQQVEKEQSGHRIDVMALSLRAIIGIRYPIAEVFMIFFLFFNLFQMSPVTHTRNNIVCWMDWTGTDLKKLLK